MPTARVVEGLQVVEHRELRLPVLEPAAGLLVEQPALQGQEYALRERVVEAAGHAAQERQSAVTTGLRVRTRPATWRATRTALGATGLAGEERPERAGDTPGTAGTFPGQSVTFDSRVRHRAEQTMESGG